MKLKLHFIKKWLKQKICTGIRLHVPNFLYFTKKSFLTLINVNNWKKLLINQLMSKLAIFLRLRDNIFFFVKWRKFGTCKLIQVHPFCSSHFLIKLSFDFNIFSIVECIVMKLNVWIIWRKYTFQINCNKNPF